ncbi:sensor histidine kinase [Arenibacter latericius]|uniref:sensor histidine kinase n=1 Tax=Arenibacter latericius TaxID=86104 RepID=UPI0006889B67|nr:sensor histidine kinase [Arenibacter latericius]MDX1364083.1 sensor histidine kinase [Arenibacter latericius]
MEKRLVLISLALFVITTATIWRISFQRVEVYRTNVELVEEIKADNRLSAANHQLGDLYNFSKKHVFFIRDLIKLDLESDLSIELIKEKLGLFLKTDDNYFLARFIDALGMEIIRVEDNKISDVDIIQYKGNRYFFKESIKLKQGDLYVSNLDLNMEHGEIEIPYRPTIRFFTPLFLNDELRGVVGLNLKAQNWLNHFKRQNVGLLTDNRKDLPVGFGELYPISEEELHRKNLNENPIYSHRKVNLEGKTLFTLYTKINNDLIDKKVKDYKKRTFLYAFLLNSGVVLFLFIIYSLYRKNAAIYTLNDKIETRIKERELLLKEIHHRVKNNLQVITGLLSLQSTFIKDEATKGLFRYGQYRINSMSIIHEMLYQSDDLTKIDYEEYLNRLVTNLITSMKGDVSKINLSIKADELYLNLDTSVPLGLIINEIVTNSLKYGIVNDEKGSIYIEIEKLDYPNYLLKIGDDGIGFPEDLDFRNIKSLGLKLIHKLVVQVKGSIEKDNSKLGTHYIIKFQEIEEIL